MTDVTPLLLSKKQAAEYLGCSVEELLKWVIPDRVVKGDPRRQGMRLWSGVTLQSAKPSIELWRQRDKRESDRRRQEIEAEHAAAVARRKGMRKAGALLAAKVCEMLGCTRTELNRWASDGRLPPDGAIHLYIGKSLDARAWLPVTVQDAKARIDSWRKKDEIVKTARRRRPRVVRGYVRSPALLGAAKRAAGTHHGVGLSPTGKRGDRDGQTTP